jgi:hypothetical protein
MAIGVCPSPKQLVLAMTYSHIQPYLLDLTYNCQGSASYRGVPPVFLDDLVKQLIRTPYTFSFRRISLAVIEKLEALGERDREPMYQTSVIQSISPSIHQQTYRHTYTHCPTTSR